MQESMKQWLAFMLLLILSLVLTSGGFEGSMGRILACFLAPSEIVMNE